MTNFFIAGFCDPFCDPGNLCLLKSLLNQKDILDPLACDPVIQISHTGNIQFFHPFLRFFLNPKDFFLRRKRRDLIRSVPFRKFQYKAFVIRLQIKISEITGMACHISVKVILIIPNTVKVYPGYSPIAKKLLFVIHPVFMEKLDRFMGTTERFWMGRFASASSCHPGLYPIQKLLVRGCTLLYGKIISGAYRIMDHHIVCAILARNIINRF